MQTLAKRRHDTRREEDGQGDLTGDLERHHVEANGDGRDDRDGEVEEYEGGGKVNRARAVETIARSVLVESAEADLASFLSFVVSEAALASVAKLALVVTAGAPRENRKEGGPKCSNRSEERSSCGRPYFPTTRTEA